MRTVAILLLFILVGCNQPQPDSSATKDSVSTLTIENTLPIGSNELTRYAFPEKWENLTAIDDQNPDFSIDNISPKGYDSIFYFIEKNASSFYERLVINKNIGFNANEIIQSNIKFKSGNIRLDSAYFVRTIAEEANYVIKLYKNGNKYQSLLTGENVDESYNYLLLVTTDRKDKPIDYKVIYFSNNRFEHFSRFFYIDRMLNITTKDFFIDELNTTFLNSDHVTISKMGYFSTVNAQKTTLSKSLNEDNLQPLQSLRGSYSIKTDAISNYDQTKIKLEYYLSFESDSRAILSIGAEQVQDYGCEGDYTLTQENGILHGRGICDQDDVDDFYIKKENNQLFIKSKRFLNQDWQQLTKD